MREYYIDPSLSEENRPMVVCYIKQIDSWVLQSGSPASNNIDTYGKDSKENILRRFPETAELLSLELDRNVTFRKGRGAAEGHWYDFV